MTRPDALDYAGARGHISLEQAARLGPRWVLQPKVDGCYARVYLDSCGRIAALYSRAGRLFPTHLVADLLGAFVGRPRSWLVGELEAHTESGNRAAAIRGWRALHLFDLIRDGDRDVTREPYHVRRDLLWRAQSEAECLGSAAPWYRDSHGARAVQSGRWCRAVPTDCRVAPIVSQVAPARAGALWDEVVGQGGEGLVAVNLDAPLGARGAKRKIKQTDEREAVVVSADNVAATLLWAGQRFVVSNRGGFARAGEIVTFAHDGFYEAGGRVPGHDYGAGALPRFARIVRRRPDLGCYGAAE